MSNQTPLNLNERVWEIVKKIPKGKVTTYGEIAVKLGNPKLSRQVGWPFADAHDKALFARAVGNALHSNTDPRVPCHRVVDRNGRLAPNFAFNGAKEQKRRLEQEGVKFKDEMHVDMKLKSQIANFKI